MKCLFLALSLVELELSIIANEDKLKFYQACLELVKVNLAFIGKALKQQKTF